MVEKAEKIADEYMAEKLQEEMLDNDDDIEFQFRNPDLFRM